MYQTLFSFFLCVWKQGISGEKLCASIMLLWLTSSVAKSLFLCRSKNCVSRTEILLQILLSSIISAYSTVANINTEVCLCNRNLIYIKYRYPTLCHLSVQWRVESPPNATSGVWAWHCLLVLVSLMVSFMSTSSVTLWGQLSHGSGTSGPTDWTIFCTLDSTWPYLASPTSHQLRIFVSFDVVQWNCTILWDNLVIMYPN